MMHLHRSLKVWLPVAMATAAACSKANGNSEGTAAAPGSAASPKAAVPEAPVPTPLEVLLGKDTLEGAIDYLRPQMTDTNDETSPAR